MSRKVKTDRNSSVKLYDYVTKLLIEPRIIRTLMRLFVRMERQKNQQQKSIREPRKVKKVLENHIIQIWYLEQIKYDTRI